MGKPLYERTSKSSVGTSMQRYFDAGDNITTTKILTVFGERDKNAYVEPEKGYDGEDRVFENTSSGEIVSIYTRYGEWRIGARNKEIANGFYEWFRAEILRTPTADGLHTRYKEIAAEIGALELKRAEIRKQLVQMGEVV